MTFIVSSNGVLNTDGTTAKFGSGGSVRIGGDFSNSGKVEVDIGANLEVVGDVVNRGSFDIKDYCNAGELELIRSAIHQLGGEPRMLLDEVYKQIRIGKGAEAKSGLVRFINYLKTHPELVVGSVQTLLQLFVQ